MGSLGPEAVSDVVTVPHSGRLHHVEIWVRDLAASRATLGWLFQELGYTTGDSWPRGTSYVGAHDYLVIESGPDVIDAAHQRRFPGLNHLAFVAGSRTRVDELTAAAVDRGFTLLFTDAHPHAGGPEHYAAYLEDYAGFEIELVADKPEGPSVPRNAHA